MMMKTILFVHTLLLGTLSAVQPCRIEVVDKSNGWPVPLVELRSTHETRHVTDNFGLIALDSPELLGRELWFHVRGHGYGLRKDGFGYEGVRLTPQPGGSHRLEVERRFPAKRLGRLTGAGLYAEGEKLGMAPLLPETGVFGCDSVSTAAFGGRLFWIWGDTTLPGYPLGVFHMSAATTPLPPPGKWEPPVAMPFTYFRGPEGKPRGVAEMPGSGPTWLSGLVSWPDGKMGATYAKIRGFLQEYELGLCVWEKEEANFKRQRVVWKDGDGPKPLVLQGHPLRWRDASGKNWLLFGDPFPAARCPDDFEAWNNPETWERIPAPEAPRDATGRAVRPHRGAVVWNAPRERWVSIFTESKGKPSAFGEIWFAEAKTPFGPWHNAVKVLSHDNHTFYNPVIHTGLCPADSPFLLFEGTYTAEFSDHAAPTPRHNYNQILYRLDFSDLPPRQP